MILETPNINISIVGAAMSGKTTYKTVMLSELQRTFDLPYVVSHLNNESLNWFREHQMYLFDQRCPVAPTNPMSIEPTCWALRSISAHKTCSLTIFDCVGEDYKNTMGAGNDYIKHIGVSDVLIFVIDPLSFKAVRECDIASDEMIRNSCCGMEIEPLLHPGDVISSVANYIKQVNGLDVNKKTKKPVVAVVLSKLDTIISHPIFQDSVIKRQSNFQQGYMGEMDAVHDEISNFLHAVGESQLIHMLDSYFHTYKFFGVSSLGSPSIAPSKFNEIHAHRVLDPIHWLLTETKII